MIFVFDRWETIPFITWSRLEFWRSRETRLKLLKPYRWPWHCQGSKHQVGDIRYIKNSCWKLCHFCDDTIYNIYNIMPSCISQFEYTYMIYTHPINHRVLSFEQSTVSFAYIYAYINCFMIAKKIICITGKGPMAKKGKGTDISTNDRVSVFLELAEAHTALGETVSFFQIFCHHFVSYRECQTFVMISYYM